METAAGQKTRVSKIYDEIAPRYDQVGPPFYARNGEKLVSRMAPRVGERVLDAGCGRGACLFAAAAAVGPTGQVVGIDGSSGMVRETAAEAARRDLANVVVTVGDAEAPEFAAGSFDVVVSGFVLRLLPDPEVAVRAYHRLLRPHGRLGATVFVSGFVPRWRPVERALAPFLGDRRSEPDAFDSTEAFADLVSRAGFDDVEVGDDPFDIELLDPARWWEYLWFSGYRGLMERIPVAERDRARDIACAAAEGLREPDGRLVMGVHVRCATAVRR